MREIREKWCRFVLCEGLIPSQIMRKLRFHAQDEVVLLSFLADLLLNKECAQFDHTPLAGLNGAIKLAFAADEELSQWLESVKDILGIIKAHANSGDVFTKIVDEACISFIKSCNIVPEDIRSAYICSSEKSSFVSNNILGVKQNYKNYLQAEGYSINTINSYVSGINKVSSISSIGRDIWAISDATEMQSLFNEIETNANHIHDEYKIKDQESRKICSNALKQYISFLSHK